MIINCNYEFISFYNVSTVKILLSKYLKLKAVIFKNKFIYFKNCIKRLENFIKILYLKLKNS